mmetsp:Transcript_34707/g.83854  ORF Transcript_34707/g.83854 Transcript_34707/m.83854 type:complete len:563 (-) Transcript_34707:55-1743(-)
MAAMTGEIPPLSPRRESRTGSMTAERAVNLGVSIDDTDEDPVYFSDPETEAWKLDHASVCRSPQRCSPPSSPSLTSKIVMREYEVSPDGTRLHELTREDRMMPSPAFSDDSIVPQPPQRTMSEPCLEQPLAAESSAGNAVSLTGFLWDEAKGRPDEKSMRRVEQLPTHMTEVVQILKAEKVLCLGMLVCFDALLHELTVMPLQAVCAIGKLSLHGFRWRGRRWAQLSVAESIELCRFVVLACSVLLFHFVDVTWVYHTLRGQSFMKLYVIFNMIEILERLARSVGSDMIDWLLGAHRGVLNKSMKRYVLFLLVLVAGHTSMHMARLMLLHIALNSSKADALFLMLLTNNFAEIKTTVFKNFKEEGLFVIVASDCVERLYLCCDIVLVLLHMFSSPRYEQYNKPNVMWWLFIMVVLEIFTDWIKFFCISKFCKLSIKTFSRYRDVVVGDILSCRLMPGQTGHGFEALDLKHRNVYSFSYIPAQRFSFVALPLATLIITQSRSALGAFSQRPTERVLLCLCIFLVLCLIKASTSILLVGHAARRRPNVGDLKGDWAKFRKVKAL